MLRSLKAWLAGADATAVPQAIQPHVAETSRPVYGLGDYAGPVLMPANAQYDVMLTAPIVVDQQPYQKGWSAPVPPPMVTSGAPSTQSSLQSRKKGGGK